MNCIQKHFYDIDDPKKALKQRQLFEKEMKGQGFNCIKSTSNQLISRGGIGTNQPHMEYWVKSYQITCFKE